MASTCQAQKRNAKGKITDRTAVQMAVIKTSVPYR
jgi:hypothetical protein